ncbi:hypothetical protein BC2926_01870 [Bacillus cereus]|nr:hypothetical protein BC2926_01870 [Bacillus cereus]
MRKYRPPLLENEISELERLSQLNFDGWSEADVREEFIVPLLIILGYRKGLNYSISREDSYKLNPLFLQIGRDRIKLDYICSVRKQKFWIVEAKPGGKVKKGEPPIISEEDIAQAQFYSLHPDVDAKYFIVTNGWYIHLYERDKMNEDTTPILAFRNNELLDKFTLLDSYIGSTQILYNIKKKILKDIETTLSAEVHLDRLDEFIVETKLSVNKIRPNVMRNFRENSKIQRESQKQKFIDFLQKEDLDYLVSSVLMVTYSRGEMRDMAKILVDRFFSEPSMKQYLFLNKLLLEKGRAVPLVYYYNVLELLIEIYKRKIDLIPIYQKDTVQIINEWVELCLFHFWNRKELRYLWIIEGLLGRSIIRLLFLDSKTRKSILEQANLELFYTDEEEVAWMGPSPAKNIVEITDNTIIRALNVVFQKFFEGGKVREVLINQYIKEINAFILIMESKTKEYRKIREELGTDWGELNFYEAINNPFDKLSSGICDVLSENKELVQLLSENVKKRLSMQVYLGNVNFADECLKHEKQRWSVQGEKSELIKQYFSIDTDTFEFTNKYVKRIVE